MHLTIQTSVWEFENQKTEAAVKAAVLNKFNWLSAYFTAYDPVRKIMSNVQHGMSNAQVGRCAWCWSVLIIECFVLFRCPSKAYQPLGYWTFRVGHWIFYKITCCTICGYSVKFIQITAPKSVKVAWPLRNTRLRRGFMQQSQRISINWKQNRQSCLWHIYKILKCELCNIFKKLCNTYCNWSAHLWRLWKLVCNV